MTFVPRACAPSAEAGALRITSDNIHLSEPTRTPPSADFPVNWNDPDVLRFLEAATAPSTRRAYRADVEHFLAWGGAIPSGPDVVARYLAHHASVLATATLTRRLVGISRAHVAAALPDPTKSDLVRRTLRGIRRVCGKPQRRVAAMMPEDLAAICAGLGNCTKDVRDRAILLVGFAGAFRRSELVGLDCKHVERSPDGLAVTIARSKTDQEGRGRKVIIPVGRGPFCPVAAFECWLAASGIAEGPVFRPVSRAGAMLPGRLSSEAVALIIKKGARAIGRDPARYSGHSLRAGFATAAATAGIPEWRIRLQTGHAADSMLARYIRQDELCNGSHM
jgi:integrase